MVSERIGQISLGRFMLLWGLSATLILIVISLVLGRGAVDKRIWQDAEALGKAEITRISLIAERVIGKDKALLNEMLSQSVSDPRIEQILVVDPDDRVLFASRASYRGRQIAQIPGLDPQLLKTLASHGPLYSASNREASRLYFAQSFVWLPPPGKLRSDQLGYVVVVMNLANTQFQNRAEIMRDQLAVAGIFLVVLLLLLGGFFLLTQKPLRDLTLAADKYRTGDFSYKVQVVGIRELKELAESFSMMSQEIEGMLAELQQSEFRFRSLIEHSPIGILAFDGNSRLTYTNAAFSRMTGIAPERLAGADAPAVDAMLSAQTDGDHMPPVLAQRDAGALPHTIELQQPELRIMALSVVDLNLPQLGRIAYFQDITALSRVDRMKSEFISTAAHELRTPMSMVLGYAELLKMGMHAPEQAGEMIEAIHTQARSIVYLLNELLDLARIEAGADKAFNFGLHPIAPLVQSLAGSFMLQGDPRRVELVALPLLPELRIDPEKIGQALKNCLSNAYKFSAQDSVVRMSAAVAETSWGREVQLSVSDHGIGMTPEQMARMFDKFYRADTSGKIPGTGLGMTLVKEIIERHGGRVMVESTLGAGTTITLCLPVPPATGAS